jgi:hypothetical protein
LQIIALIAYVTLAMDTSRVIARNRALFEEFNVAPSLRLWIWLYPVAMALYLLPSPILRLLVARLAIGTVFFIPGIVSAVRTREGFERAGTDRVDSAGKAADHAVFGGIVGIIAVLTYTIMSWVFEFLGDPLRSIL